MKNAKTKWRNSMNLTQTLDTLFARVGGQHKKCENEMAWVNCQNEMALRYRQACA
jgi:hypothetical protein